MSQRFTIYDLLSNCSCPAIDLVTVTVSAAVSIVVSVSITVCGATLTAQRIVAAGWRFAQQIVVLADELIVVKHVQLLAGAQLLAANAAREAVQMEHLVARLSHQIRRCNALATAAALCAITSERRAGGSAAVDEEEI